MIEPDFQEPPAAGLHPFGYHGQAVPPPEEALRSPPAWTGPETHIDFELKALELNYGAGEYERALQHGLRALRLTRKVTIRKGDVRRALAEVLLRLGRTDTCERLIRRTLADFYAANIQSPMEIALFNVLGRVYRRRGALTLSIHAYGQALATHERIPGADPLRLRSIRRNLVLSLAPKGEFEAARSILHELYPDPGTIQDVHDHLVIARYAEHADDWDLYEAHVRGAERYLDECDYRTRLLIAGFHATLDTVRGRASDAIPTMEEALRESRQKAPLGDLVPVNACVLASALYAVGRYEEALQHARIAAKTGRHADLFEWAVSLRLAGECLAAQGRRESAASAFAEAILSHDTTEFIVERSRLESSMQRLGYRPVPGSGMAGTRPTAQSRRARPIRISTSDGRPFITHDVTLVSKLRLAASDLLPVLIEGETGTGKELVACLIHEFGGESRPFVIVDCTSLTETLVEVELFGATRGAYTGAVTDRPGLIATANGGTLFLDELPELSLPVQAKLLRLLQEGTYRRVGEDRQRHVSLRIIATTNQGVEMLLAGNKLKRDLFYRLNGHRLHLTPLRESPQVIETLSLCFAEAAGFTGISPSALKALKAYPWPGNVRELEMLIKRVASEGQRGGRLEESLVQEFTLTSRTSSEPTGVPGTLFHARRDAERRTLERAMLEHGGNVSAAARALSMSRQALYKALKRTGLL